MASTNQLGAGESLADIAIVGGGPAGLSLAAICERRGISYILYEHSSKDTHPRGASLDLHPPSGQRAMKEAGAWDAFQKYARYGGFTEHRVFDIQGNHRYSFGGGRDAPEIDRHDIKRSLLTVLPDEKICWRKTLLNADRDEDGQIVLTFTDGDVAKGFKLVVGADGMHSKIRPLITPVDPGFSGIVSITCSVSPDNPMYQRLRERVGDSPHVVMGRKKLIWIQIQGSGKYHVSFGVHGPADYYHNGTVDIDDIAAVKRFLTSDKHFGRHDQFYIDMINALTGPFRDWVINEMPVQALGWKPSADVTLIGDAAHTTTPYIGEGANSAMLDAVVLMNCIRDHGLGKAAIATYEKEMFARTKEVISLSAASGRLFFEDVAPAGFIEAMERHNYIQARDEVGSFA